MEVSAVDRRKAAAEFFGEEFPIRRPLLQAISSRHGSGASDRRTDRADEEFEGYLLELLADSRSPFPKSERSGQSLLPSSSSRRTGRGSCMTR